MIFRIFGTRIEITVLFTAVVAFMLILDRTGMMTGVLAATLLHEIGHLFVMYRLKCSPKSVTLKLGSINIEKSNVPLSSMKEVKIAFAGPFVNLLCAVAAYILYLFTGHLEWAVFSSVQIVVAVFNLIPVLGLDGGTILFTILSSKLTIDKALRIMQSVSVIITMLIIAAGLYIFIYMGANPSLLFVATYLIAMQCMKPGMP